VFYVCPIIIQCRYIAVFYIAKNIPWLRKMQNSGKTFPKIILKRFVFYLHLHVINLHVQNV